MASNFLPFVLIAALACLLLAAGIEDARIREISNRKNAAIALLSPLWWWSTGVAVWPTLPLQLGVALLVFAFFVLAFQLGQMGGGDVKLIGALALWLPPAPLVMMLMVMAIAGGVITLLMLAEHKWRRFEHTLEIPYGVAIAIAGLLALREPLVNQFS